MTDYSPAQASGFAKAGDQLFALAAVVRLDFSKIEALEVGVHLADGSVLVARSIDAIELAMLTKPSVLESRRLRWPKHVWAVHNLIGHPLMQLLAFFKCYRLAFKVHDGTVPRPLGGKDMPD